MIILELVLMAGLSVHLVPPMCESPVVGTTFSNAEG